MQRATEACLLYKLCGAPNCLVVLLERIAAGETSMRDVHEGLPKPAHWLILAAAVINVNAVQARKAC